MPEMMDSGGPGTSGDGAPVPTGTGSSGAPGGRSDAARMSRRQLVGWASKGAVAAGVAAWVVPEIIVATPTAAGAMSSPPTSPGGGGGGGSGGGVTAPGGSAQTAGSGGNGAGASPGGGGAGSQGSPQAQAAAAGSHSGSGSLPFTGSNTLRDAEIGAGLIAGGWALNRWASRARPDGGEPAGGS